MRALIVLPMFAALALAGCGADDKAGEGKANPDTGKIDGTLVKLKVPGMEWGMCERSVKSALTKVEGISVIDTDVPTRMCSISVTDKNLDVKAKLDELAESNSHMKGYEVIE
jgi:copper chaperone CopZ